MSSSKPSTKKPKVTDAGPRDAHNKATVDSPSLGKKARAKTKKSVPPEAVIDTDGTLSAEEAAPLGDEQAPRDAGNARESDGPDAASEESSDGKGPGREGAEDDDSAADELDDEALAQEAVYEAAGESLDEGADSPALLPAPLVKSRALATSDPMAAYMREVQQHPLLTKEEEHKLAVHYAETGDVKAAARLVTANLRLVVKLAYEYRRAYRNMMDLVQEGNIGLMQAVKRYDPYRGVKLSSYAAWWIRAYMLRYILNNWRLVKLGTTQAQRKLFFNLNKEKAKLTALGIEPTHGEIAERLNVDEKDVMEMDRRLARGDASLDAPVGDSEGRQTSRLELLPTGTASPERLTESAELSDMLRGHLLEFRETLKGKDIEIFDKRLIAEEPMTLQELGDHFGISRERIRQLEARITGKLRDYLREKLGDAVEVS